MSLSRRSIHGVLGKIVWVSLGTPLALLATDGCTQQQTSTSLRALEHSGRVSFVCLNAPGDSLSPGRPQNDCSGVRFETPDDYGMVDGETTKPHLYALVTQTTRGEVAVIDMSTKTESVLDANPRVPGTNFLPVGAQPVDIATTNDGDAAFVAVAEVGRHGIFALPSKDLRNCATCAPKNLSDWHSCALPGAPGQMLIIDDPVKDDKVRRTCDSSYETFQSKLTDSKGQEIVNVVDPKLGRPKIVVTIPERGALAVIDAQSLFDQAVDDMGKPVEEGGAAVYNHPPGSWNPCKIEYWQPLKVDVPVETPPPTGAGGPACVDRKVDAPSVQVAFEPHPMGMARSQDKLFIADTKAPVIHVFDMKTPCEPLEVDPLLPSSAREPERVVTTNAVTVSGVLASTLEQFVYAVDDYDGSLMVFDVSPTSTSRRPLLRKNQPWAPFQPPDRIDLGVPVQDLVLIERPNSQVIPASGILVEGVRCSPDPSLTVCTADSMSCDPATLYRTGAAYDRGAGPTRMRGAFVYALLSTGQIAVVDVDDYDADCRIPRRPSHLNGCPAELIGHEKDYESSGEASCNAVVPHTLRDAVYVRSSDKTGQNQPGIQSFPSLYTDEGTLQALFDPNGVVMRATLPEPPVEKEQFNLAVATGVWVIDKDTGLVTAGGEVEHSLAANVEDPRAHTSSQSFSVIYEGALPGFSGKAAKLSVDVTPATFDDASSRFCDQGVLGQKAFVEMLMAETPGLSKADAEKRALEMADYVQILSSTPAEDDNHWATTAKGVCTYDQCQGTFGPIEIPKTTRDFKVIEAYQDHLELSVPNDLASLAPCCFPSLLAFNVRVGHQWAVIGTNSGFIHHVVPTPLEGSTADRAVGVCRNSCDPRDVRKNGRVRPVPHGEIVKDGSPYAFINPFFRFSINEAAPGNQFDANPKSDADNAPTRGTFFQFATQGQFRPLLSDLVTTLESTEVQPQSIGFVPATGEMVVVDGSLQGIILMNAGTLGINRQYY